MRMKIYHVNYHEKLKTINHGFPDNGMFKQRVIHDDCD